MPGRFGMTLRRRYGPLSTTASLRPRRRMVPPKKDDSSVLTWKEQQMIARAQHASLRTSASKHASPNATVPGDQDDDDPTENMSSNTYSLSDSDENISLISSETNSSAFHPIVSKSKNRVDPKRLFSKGGNFRRTSENSKHNRNRSSSFQSYSRQSFGSIGSFSDLINSPRQSMPSGGFAARKSAYTGDLSDSDEDVEDIGDTRNGYDVDGASPSRKLPPLESLPTTSDFINYLVLKGINCVTDDLRYIGDLTWETVLVKRKYTGGVQKKQESAISSLPADATITSPIMPNPKQSWAKKAIARAKKSLIEKRDGKHVVSSSIKSSDGTFAKRATSSPSQSPSLNTRRERQPKKRFSIECGKGEDYKRRKKTSR